MLLFQNLFWGTLNLKLTSSVYSRIAQILPKVSQTNCYFIWLTQEMFSSNETNSTYSCFLIPLCIFPNCLTPFIFPWDSFGVWKLVFLAFFFMAQGSHDFEEESQAVVSQCKMLDINISLTYTLCSNHHFLLLLQVVLFFIHPSRIVVGQNYELYQRNCRPFKFCSWISLPLINNSIKT